MKRLMSFQMVAIFWILMLATQGVGGTWTDKEFFYKPGVGARGETEKNTFDTGLDRVDARLGKEIWLGDPSYGTSLQSAIAAIGSNNVTLRMPAGNHAISADQMVPANITLRPERGALLIVATGKTLILNGGIEAGLYQIFSCVGTGKVVFGSPAQLVHSAWFDTLQNAANAVPSGGALRLNAGTYALSAATLTLSTANISVIGDGDSSLITTSSGANKGVYVTAAGVTLKNFAFRPSGTYSGNCIYFENAPGGTAENLAVDGSTATTNFGNSIHITGSANCQVKNNRLIGINGATQRSWNSIQIDDASPNCRVQGNTIIGSRQRGVNVRSGTGLSTGTQIINNYVSNTAEIGIITWNGQTLIKGNVLDGCGLNGIDVTGDPSDSGGTTNNGSIVTGNLVKNITGTSTGIGMEDDVHFCTITGNTVLNCASDGIGMVRNITDCVVMGNAISACGRNGISSYLYTGEPNQRLTISNNMVKGSGRYGIYTEMASGNTIKVTNNSVSSSTTADFTLATGTLAYGNPGYSGGRCRC